VKIRKIERLQASLQHWRTRIAQNVRENSERNRLLTDERNAIQEHFQLLRGRMNSFRDAQARRLSELTQNACAAKGRLEAQAELASRILKLAELARKAETEAEKVVPYYASPHTDAVEREAAAALEQERKALQVGDSPAVTHHSCRNSYYCSRCAALSGACMHCVKVCMHQCVHIYV
jgi:dynein regulatory complex subunit 2